MIQMDNLFSFPLTVWITGMETRNLHGMDFYQMQTFGIHFDLPGNENKQTLPS